MFDTITCRCRKCYRVDTLSYFLTVDWKYVLFYKGPWLENLDMEGLRRRLLRELERKLGHA